MSIVDALFGAAVVAAFVGGFLMPLALGQSAEASPGQYCTSSRACAPREICIADSEWASTGRCVRARVLP